MPLSLAFWVLMLLWLVSGVYVTVQTPPPGRFAVVGPSLVLFLLLLVVGLKLFGAPLHGG